MSTQETDTSLRLRCIWCGKSSGPGEPTEHIVPEAIGCPADFILSNGEVCGACNNGLAHLDHALVGDLEVYATMAGVPRKGGRPPLVSSYGNFRAGVRSGKTEFYFNMDQNPVPMPDGKMLPPYRGKARDVSAKLELAGSQATISYEIPFGTSSKVARALVKLGAEYLCWGKGRDLAAKVIDGPVADFVRLGKGKRPIILGGGDKTKYEHRFDHLACIGKDGWYCKFRLAHFEVMVDLSPELTAFDSIATRMFEAYGGRGWTTLPPEAFAAPPKASEDQD